MKIIDDNSLRYYVDKRAGCVAVRDRENTDADDNGPNPHQRGVMFFRLGSYTQDTGWVLSGVDITNAENECARLNAANAEAHASATEGRR